MKKWITGSWFVFIIFLVAVFFYKTIAFGLLPVPTDALVGLYHPWRDIFASQYPRGVPFKNFLITDPVRQQIPWRKLVIDSWKTHTFPGWNPFTFAGTPLAANIQAAPFYPLNVLFFILPFPIAWTALIILQPLLAALFLYAYLRHLKRSHVASFLGAFAWSFCGFSVAWLTWGTIVQTALWLPLTLLSVDTILETRKRGPRFLWSVVLFVSLVMTVTAGHAQIALYCFLVSAAYFIWRFRQTKNFMPFPYVAIAALAAFAFTAVQWMPLLRFLPETVRSVSVNSWKSAGWFVPWQHLAQFIAPDFFGNPATLNYWGVWNYGELVGYIGIIPLIFALSALFMGGITAFFSATLCIALVFMLSNPIAILPFFFRVPFFSMLQPTRLLMVVDFSLAVLAAYGFDLFFTKSKRGVYAAFTIGASFFVLWLTVFAGKSIFHGISAVDWSVAKHNLMLPSILFLIFLVWVGFVRLVRSHILKEFSVVLLFAVVIFDLFRFGWKFTPFTPVAYWYPQSPTLQLLSREKTPGRVMSLDDRILPPNTTSWYGIESIEGYDPVSSLRYDRFLSAFEIGAVDFSRQSGFNRIYTAHNIDSPLLPYLNVRYILSLSDISRDFLHLIKTDGDVRIYENDKMLPRVYLADKVVVVNSDEDALKKLLSSSPEPIGIVETPIDILSVPLSEDEGVKLEEYGSDLLRIRVMTVNPRLLVILNSYAPGWHASIDGKDESVMPTNYLFSGVVIPQGTHEVVLSYR